MDGFYMHITPLDVVKIRLQSQQKAMLSNRCFLYCNGLMDHICECVNGKVNVWVKRPAQFTSTIDAFGKIIRHEGALSLWSGLPPTLVMAVPATMVYFVTFEQLRVFLGDQFNDKAHLGEQPMWIPLVAGSVARLWAVTVVNPLELIRTKMQSKRLRYRELLGACRSLYDAKGIRGFWLGWSPSIMRDVPFSAIYWTTYEVLKRTFHQTNQPHPAFSFLAGAASGSFAGMLTLPFDVVKTHRQIELGETQFAEKQQKLSTTGQILKKIYTTQGVRGLFTGFVPRLVKVAPACAIMLSTYEYGKSFFLHYNKEQYEKNKR